MPSFDIVSKMNSGELKNAVDQARREISTRYDFKGSNTAINLNDSSMELMAPDDYKMKTALSILRSKMAKRNIGQKFIDPGEISPVGNKMLKQQIVINQGISKEQGKIINRIVKNSKKKLSSSYMDEKVRISGKKIDDLQDIFFEIKKNKEITVELQMENMKR